MNEPKDGGANDALALKTHTWASKDVIIMDDKFRIDREDSDVGGYGHCCWEGAEMFWIHFTQTRNYCFIILYANQFAHILDQ